MLESQFRLFLQSLQNLQSKSSGEIKKVVIWGKQKTLFKNDFSASPNSMTYDFQIKSSTAD
jgi:hypothetical protein